MDFRMYDNAIGKFYGMDALSEKNHYLSPFQFGNGNPVYYSDPSGLTALKLYQDYDEPLYGSGGIEHAIGGGGSFDVFSVGGGGGGGRYGSGSGDVVGGTMQDLLNSIYKEMDRLGVNSYSINRNSNGVFWATYAENDTNYESGMDWMGTSIISVKFDFGNGSSGWNFSNNSLNGFDWVGNIAGIASTYPTIDGVWKYQQNRSNTWWRGKNGNYYNKNSVRFNGGYKNSMAWAERTSKTVRGVGTALTCLGIGATIGSTIYAVATDTHNTSTWVGFVAGVGLGALTIVGSPVIVTGAAITGAIWGISQLVAGDQINGWIDNNFGYR